MRIVIDGRMLAWTGIGRYTLNLLRELQKLDKTNEYVVLMQQKDWGTFTPTAKNFRKVAANIEPYSLANQTRLPGIIRRLKPDLVHFPHFTVPLTYNDPYVVTIHDLTLLDFRNVKGGPLRSLTYTGKQAAMKRVLKHAAKAAKAVISTTEFGANDLRKRLKVSAGRLRLVPLAVEVAKVSAGSLSVKKPFIMYAGNYYPYKNIGTLLKAFKLVKSSQPDLQLVLVGPEDYFQEKIKNQASNIKDVYFTGYVEYEELVALYKHAELFVFPSLSEGFGMPPLEAMAQGTPVLSSDASCMSEVLGDAAIYFDPKDPQELADEIDAALNSPEEIKQLKQAGLKQVAKYSWAKTAKQTLEVYTKASR